MLRVGAVQDMLIKGYDLAEIMRADGWSNAEIISRYLQFSRHNMLKIKHLAEVIYQTNRPIENAPCLTSASIKFLVTGI